MEIMSLADLSKVWLQTEVFERQSDWVKFGGRAKATLAYLKSLEGHRCSRGQPRPFHA
nr:efflux RND transporter periplasmic adaptor subunit [Magnetofaba australis]